MKQKDRFTLLLEKVYTLGVNTDVPAQLEFLDAVGGAFNAHITGAFLVDPDHRSYLVSTVAGFPTESVADLLARIGNRHEWYEQAAPKLRAQGVVDSAEFAREPDFKRSPFYRDYLQLMDIEHGLGLCQWVGGAGEMASVTLNRSHRRGAFTRQDHVLAHRFLPHLRNAYQLQRRLSWLEAQVATYRAALDRLNFGVVFLDRNGIMRFINIQAQQWCSEKLGLVDRGSQLQAVWPADRESLRGLINRAIAGRLAEKPDAVLLHDANGASVLSVSISPLPAASSFMWSEPRTVAILFLHRLRPSKLSQGQRFGELFKLTVAEIQLAIELVQGASLKQASWKLRKSVPTLRTQLRSLFTKTGTRKQSELLRVFDRVRG